MTLYRPHRGLLVEAMAEVVVVNGFADLVRHLANTTPEWWPEGHPTAENVEVKSYTYDDRIGWDTYIVTVNGQARGFTNGPLPNV